MKIVIADAYVLFAECFKNIYKSKIILYRYITINKYK